MTMIEKLVSEVIREKFDHLEIRKINGQLWVIFPSNRKQRINIIQQGKYYSFRSVVLGKAKVNQYYEDWILPYIWQQNKETPLVSFQIDKKGRLTGRITQLIETLDKEEFLFYIEVLAKECDRMEYVLSGKDQN